MVCVRLYLLHLLLRKQVVESLVCFFKLALYPSLALHGKLSELLPLTHGENSFNPLYKVMCMLVNELLFVGDLSHMLVLVLRGTWTTSGRAELPHTHHYLLDVCNQLN